jgi:isoleucyl-tRNA synthetase
VESDTVWVKFPVLNRTYHRNNTGSGENIIAHSFGNEKLPKEHQMYVVIWTTTPWTIPGNRAVCFSSRIEYIVYEVAEAENDFGPQAGERLIFAKSLAQSCAEKAKIKLVEVASIANHQLEDMILAHPLSGSNPEDYNLLFR